MMDGLRYMVDVKEIGRNINIPTSSHVPEKYCV